jgi:hypothetical protein
VDFDLNDSCWFFIVAAFFSICLILQQTMLRQVSDTSFDQLPVHRRPQSQFTLAGLLTYLWF